jgi:hypothetical protein
LMTTFLKENKPFKPDKPGPEKTEPEA